MLLHKSFAFVYFKIFLTALYLWWIYCSPSYNTRYTSGVQLVAHQIVMRLHQIFNFYVCCTHTLNLNNNLGTYMYHLFWHLHLRCTNHPTKTFVVLFQRTLNTLSTVLYSRHYYKTMHSNFNEYVKNMKNAIKFIQYCPDFPSESNTSSYIFTGSFSFRIRSIVMSRGL